MKRLLWLDERFPDIQRDAGSVRVCCLWSIFEKLGWEVQAGVRQTRIPSGKFPETIRVQAGLTTETFSDWATSLQSPSLVVLSRPDMAEAFLPLVREHWPECPVVFDTVDLHHVREFRHARALNSAAMLKNSLFRKRQEQSIFQAVDQVWTVSDAEGCLVRELVPTAQVATVAWFAERELAVPEFADRAGLFFVGSFFKGVSPNAEGMRWFLKEVFPVIQKEVPEVTLNVVGGEAPDWLETWAHPGVNVRGKVRDLRPYYLRARVSIAPLQAGAGIKGKVMESWAYGVPVVGTRIAAEGFPASVPPPLRQADAPETFAQEVIDLLSDPIAWKNQQTAGFDVLQQHFSVNAVLQQVAHAIDSLKRKTFHA